MNDVLQIASFFAQDLLFGVDVLQVQEIIRQVAITRVPLAPPTVSGLINVRGQIVTAIDLRRCLGLPERTPGQQAAGLILQAREGWVALIVDEIGSVFELPDDTFEPPPEILRGKLRALVSRVYTLPNRLLLVMDTEDLLTGSLDIGEAPDSVHGCDGQDRSTSAVRSSAMANQKGSLQSSTESGGAQ